MKRRRHAAKIMREDIENEKLLISSEAKTVEDENVYRGSGVGDYVRDSGSADFGGMEGGMAQEAIDR